MTREQIEAKPMTENAKQVTYPNYANRLGSLRVRGGPFNGKISPRVQFDENGIPPEYLHCVPVVFSEGPALTDADRQFMEDNVAVYRRQYVRTGYPPADHWCYRFTEDLDSVESPPVAS